MFRNKHLQESIGLLLFAIAVLWMTNPLHTSLQDRDKLLVSTQLFTAYKFNITAKDFCTKIRGNSVEIPCSSISNGLEQKINDELRNNLNAELLTSINSYQSLKNTLSTDTQHNQYKLHILEILDKRIIDLQLAKDKAVRQAYSNGENKAWLNALLLAQGYSYNEYSDKFKPLAYDLARFVSNPDLVKSQLNNLGLFSKYLPTILVVWLLLYFAIVRNRLNFLGSILFSMYALVITFGLVIIRDASLNFGIESSLYHLNPFRLLMERQLYIIFGNVLVFSFIIYFSRFIVIALEYLMHEVSISVITAITSFICIGLYISAGQALGAESIKITACLICAYLLAKHGRIIELAQQHFGFRVVASKFLKLSKVSMIGNKVSYEKQLNTTDYFRIYLIQQIFKPLIFLFITIGLAALIFSDLGGSLIAVTIIVFSLFTLLGKTFASLIFISSTFLITTLIITSEKVRGRFQLMLEPMHANVSDFARLIEFDRAGQPWGYGFNKIQWCSNDGVCVPLQSLSDYMPTLISGMLGHATSVVFFSLAIIITMILIYKSFLPAWYFDNQKRYTSMFSCLLCVATLAQLIVTLLGNWRLIPLTGLGTPLISIGLSSILAANIGIALALSLAFSIDE